MNTRSWTAGAERDLSRDNPEQHARSGALRAVSRLGVLLLLAVGVLVCILAVPASADAAAASTRYQQTDPNIVYAGSWSPFNRAEASGGTYTRSASVGASATIYFTGTRLDWIAMTGSTPGIVGVYLDGVLKATVDLYSATPKYQVVAWTSGTISDGAHKVELRRSNSSAAGEYLVVDAVDIWGTIASKPVYTAKAVKASWLQGYLTGLTSRLAPYSAYIAQEAQTYNVPVQLALTFFKDENGWWRESYCTQFPRSWDNKNVGNLGFSSWQVSRYPGTVVESGHTSNVFAAFPSVENGIDAWFYLMRVRSATYSAGIDQILAGDVQGGFETILHSYAPSAGATRVNSDVTYYNAISNQIASEYGYVGDPGPPTRYQQNDPGIAYSGSWSVFSKTEASGGSYRRSQSIGASATIHFTGTRLDWIAMTGSTPGIVDVYLDDVWKATIDLYSATPQYQVLAWSTGTISNTSHKVELRRSNTSAASEYLVLDAVDIFGTIG
jgi:hypothetical protein